MIFRAYFKHMPTSMATYAYAEKKLGKQLEKFSLKVLEAHVTFWVEHGVYRVNCHIVADGAIEVAVGTEDAVSMNAAIDALEGKIEACLKKAKGKLRRHVLRPIVTSEAETPASAAADAIDASEILQFEMNHRHEGRRLVPAEA